MKTLGVATLINTIVHGNTRRAGAKEGAAPGEPDDVYVSHYYHADAHQLMLGKANVRHCCIGQTTVHTTRQRSHLGPTARYDPSRYRNTVAQAGLVEGAPGFLDPARHDYRLRPDSPCIDAGTAEDWMAEAKDLAGAPRIHATAPDIGAYERASDRPPSRQ